MTDQWSTWKAMMLSNKTLLFTLLIVDSLKYIRVHRSRVEELSN